MKVAVVLVSFHTYGWTQACVTSFVQHVLGQEMLVLDNNPYPGQVVHPKAKYMAGWGGDFAARRYFPRRSWSRFCEAERSWLLSQPAVRVIHRPTDGLLWHGEAMNVLLRHCHGEGYDVMVHVEPDCVFSGRVWYDDLVAAISSGCWMASGTQNRWGILHPTPSAWLVNRAVQFNFSPTSKVTPEEFRVSHEKVWDTGELAWYRCHINGKAAKVRRSGCFHYYGGSYRKLAPGHPLVGFL